MVCVKFGVAIMLSLVPYAKNATKIALFFDITKQNKLKTYFSGAKVVFFADKVVPLLGVSLV